MAKAKILRTGNFIRHVIGCYQSTNAGHYFSLTLVLAGYFLTSLRLFVTSKKIVDLNLKGMAVSLNCFSGEVTGFWENFLDAKYGNETIEQDRVCIMDVGGNAGFFSMLQIMRYGNKLKLFTFEPDPEVFGRLSRHLGGCNKGKDAEVNLMNAACGSKQGKTKFFRNVSCLSHVADDADDDVRCVEVLIDTLDNAVVSHQVDRINLMKIDVEGFELEVLKGAAAAALPITERIAMQYHDENYAAVVRFLKSQGFDLIWTNAEKETAMFERVLRHTAKPCGT